MTALIIYLSIALGVSFLCSIAEAVLLSVTTAYIRVLEEQGKAAASLLQRFKSDIDAPLSAILSLNTIAHTVGAAGVGAQAAVVFGDGWLGVTSAVLTFLILVFSEIIPKTLGSTYGRQLSPAVAYFLKYLVISLYPLVMMSRLLTRRVSAEDSIDGFRRDEFAAMATLGHQEGQLDEHEAEMLQNLFRLSDTKVKDVMTPTTVIFSLPADSTVESFFNEHSDTPFSRIPIYDDSSDDIEGFVLQSDLLVAQAKGETTMPLKKYIREMPVSLDFCTLLSALKLLMGQSAHLMMIVDEYGSLRGLLSLEDIFETLMGMEIMDESDTVEDMRLLARQQWQKRAGKMGIEPEPSADTDPKPTGD